MAPIPTAIALHVGMGAIWALATLTTAITGRVARPWPAILLATASLNMLAGIYLWHALHAGPWGSRERLLVAGTFCAFVALGLQLPTVLTAPRRGRLAGAALVVHRASAGLVLAAAAAMLASWFVWGG